MPPVARNTHVVPGLRRLVEGQVHAAFPHRIWVVGEVGHIEDLPDGSVRFALLADDEGQPLQLACGVPPTAIDELREVLDRIHDADLEDVLVQGRLARVGGLLRYDFVADSLHLIVSEIDPGTTAHGLQEDRYDTLERVRAAGLAQRQTVLLPAVAPTRVAVVGAPDDPELQRAVAMLAESGYAVRPDLIPVPRHAVGHGGHLARAVTLGAAHNDIVLLLRGQGRPLGLAVYDGDELARAVAGAAVPVVTGLGGGGEHTACDEVAFAGLPTAEAAASSVLVRLQAAERSLDTLSQEVASAVAQAAGRARSELRQARAAVVAAAEQAVPRAATAYRRRWIVMLAAAGLLAVVLVVVAARSASALPLVGLLVIAAALLAAQRWSSYSRTRGSRVMELQGVDFAHVLERLEQVRDELVHTSSPERVHRLRDAAAQLVARGEQILGRRLDGGPLTSEPRPDDPGSPEPYDDRPLVREPAGARGGSDSAMAEQASHEALTIVLPAPSQEAVTVVHPVATPTDGPSHPDR